MSSKAFVNINTSEFLLHVSNLWYSNILTTPKIGLNNQDFFICLGFLSSSPKRGEMLWETIFFVLFLQIN